MDIQAFYALFAATCFTLVGLWWTVVKSRPDWIANDGTRNLAGGVYLSFLIPGLMGLFAQVGGQGAVIWRTTFLIAGGLGIYFTTRLIVKTRQSGTPGPFRRNRWIVIVLYSLVILIALLPGLALYFGLLPLQLEAMVLVLLILIAHGLTWEFMTEPQA